MGKMDITFEGVSVMRRKRDVLRDVTCVLDAPLTVIMGVNGAGKSTLLHALVGVVPHRGTIRVGDHMVGPSRRRELAALIGFAPQTVRWPARMTASEVCELAARLRDVPAARARSAARTALARVGGEAIADRAVGSLSGGEHRRVTLAQALVHEPPVLVLDEPTSELDPIFSERLAVVLRDLAVDRKVVVSTHGVDDAVAWGGRLGVVARGGICWSPVDDAPRSAADVRALFRTATDD